MNDKTRTVFVGWLELTEAERRDFASEVTSAQQKSGSEQRRLLEEGRTAVKSYLGPVGQSCPCCGR